MISTDYKRHTEVLYLSCDQNGVILDGSMLIAGNSMMRDCGFDLNDIGSLGDLAVNDPG
jgi:hypothetical protein